MTITPDITLSTTVTSDPYDYTVFVQRRDSYYPPADLGAIRALKPSPRAVHDDEREAVISAVVGVWTGTAAPEIAIATMAGVLAGLFDHLEATGRHDATDLSAADEAELIAFVTTNPGHSDEPGAAVTRSEMHLRRNVINGSRLALAQLAILEDVEALEVPALAVDARSNLRGKCKDAPLEKKTRKPYNERTHSRPATHDEVLITRIASRLVYSRTARHLCTATVALITSTAATSEVPQVLWKHHHKSALNLSGYTRANGGLETQIVARTITLDPWAAQSLDLWHEECSTYRRRIDTTASMTYTGRQALASPSAKATTDQHLRNATKLAGLDKISGLSASSFRLWAAIKDASDTAGVVRGAQLAGMHLTALHRTLHQLGDRAL